MDRLVKRNNKIMIIFAILGPLFYQFVAISKVALTLGQQSYKPEMRKRNAWAQTFFCWEFERSLSSGLPEVGTQVPAGWHWACVSAAWCPQDPGLRPACFLGAALLLEGLGCHLPSTYPQEEWAQQASCSLPSLSVVMKMGGADRFGISLTCLCHSLWEPQLLGGKRDWFESSSFQCNLK